MKIDPAQRAKLYAEFLHKDAITRWFARRRKTTVQKVLLDLKITPPGSPDDPDNECYLISGKRTFAVVVPGQGDIWAAGNFKSETASRLIGNVWE